MWACPTARADRPPHRGGVFSLRSLLSQAFQPGARLPATVLEPGSFKSHSHYAEIPEDLKKLIWIVLMWLEFAFLETPHEKRRKVPVCIYI